MRYFLLAIALLASATSFADVRQLWNEMPDSILVHKSQATFVTESPDFIEAKLSSALNVQMRLMPAQDNDSVICLVRTYSAPEKESTVDIYDRNWQFISTLSYGLSDVIGEENAQKFAYLFEPLLLSISLMQESEELVLSISDKMLSDLEKKELKEVNLQRKVKWSKEILK